MPAYIGFCLENLHFFFVFIYKGNLKLLISSDQLSSSDESSIKFIEMLFSIAAYTWLIQWYSIQGIVYKVSNEAVFMSILIVYKRTLRIMS